MKPQPNQEFGGFKLEEQRRFSGNIPQQQQLSSSILSPISSVQKSLPGQQQQVQVQQNIQFTAFQQPESPKQQQNFPQQQTRQNFPQPNRQQPAATQLQSVRQQTLSQKQFSSQQQQNFPQSQTRQSLNFIQQQTRPQSFPQQQFPAQNFPQQTTLAAQQQQPLASLPKQQQQPVRTPPQNDDVTVFSQPRQFPITPNILTPSSLNQRQQQKLRIAPAEQPRIIGIFEQIKKSITSGVRFTTPSSFSAQVKPSAPPTTRRTTTTTTRLTTTTRKTTTKIRTSTTTKTTKSTTISSKPIVVSSFIDDYDDFEEDFYNEDNLDGGKEYDNDDEVRTVTKPTTPKSNPSKTDVVKSISNILDLINNLKTASFSGNKELPKSTKSPVRESHKTDLDESALMEINKILDLISDVKPKPRESQKTEQKFKLIEAQENILGLSDRERTTTEKVQTKDSNEIDFLIQSLLGSQPVPEDKSSEDSFEQISDEISESIEEDDLLLRLLNQNEIEEYEQSIEDAVSDQNLNDIVENIFDQILKDKTVVKEEKKSEEENDYRAVEIALTKLLGRNPKKQNKITPEVLATVIKLDDFLKQEEDERQERVEQVENLADKALELVVGTVDVNKQILEKDKDRNEEKDEDDKGSFSSLTPRQLLKLLRN